MKFTDTFKISSNNLYYKNTWLYKTYSFLRYNFPRFCKNIWKFRKALYNHYWFDHYGVLTFMEIGLTDMATNIEKYGSEVDSSRLKKVEKMRRVIQLIKNYNDDLYIEMAEKELGELTTYEWEFKPSENNPDFFELVDKDTPENKEHNKKIYNRAREIEEQEWNELWEILKGQNYNIFNKDEDFDEQNDGSGIRIWWD
jgi:hypothetical protein